VADVNSEIYALMGALGEDLANSMNDSLNEALNRGRGNPQAADLHFEQLVVPIDGGFKILVLASGDYWLNIEKGRSPNKKAPPSDAILEWINKNNIDAQRIIYQIRANIKEEHYQGLSKIEKKALKKQSRGLDKEVAKRQLSFIFARSIGKKGIEAKPYIDTAIGNVNINSYTEKFSDLMGKKIFIDLKLENEYEKINLTF
jgi:hypothetical protein